MEENKPIQNEEELKPPNNEQSLNNASSDEPIEHITEKSDIRNPTSEIQDMEVHHHAHDPAAPHHKKNWKSYFWEFLMLFLAVFCGFLAEYQLEHKIERDREKQYILSLMNDLKADVINMETVQKQNLEIKQIGDSLFLLLTLTDYTNSTNSIYYLGRKYSSRVFFNMTDGTFRQLTNAGGLRLIKKKNVVDSLQAYQNLYSELIKFQEIKEIQLLSYRDLMSKVFDVRVFETMVNGEIISRPTGNPPLFSQSKELINEMLMKAHFVKRNNAQLMTMLDTMKQKAINLQKIIIKEYHLK